MITDENIIWWIIGLGLLAFLFADQTECVKWKEFNVGNRTLGASGRRCVEERDTGKDRWDYLMENSK